MTQYRHPTSSDLWQFAKGNLPDKQFEEIANHLEHCDKCVGIMDGFDKGPSAEQQAAASSERRTRAADSDPSVAGQPDSDVSDLLDEIGLRRLRTASGGESANGDESPRVQHADEPLPRLKHYKLLQKLGEGGMGAVHMAEQEYPVRRKVAVKIIKPGMDSRQVIARFEAERQALAMMDHHHIAKVFDAGVTESGRSFFVMELVKGGST